MDADLVKSMVLSLLQKDEDEVSKPKKRQRPRKPDMRSPLELAKEKKKGKSKYDKAYDQRQRKNQKKDSETAKALEEFGKSEELEQMSMIERSLEENRKQREYLLNHHRKPDLPNDALEQDEQETELSKEERRRRRKEKKRAKKQAQEDFLTDKALADKPVDPQPSPESAPKKTKKKKKNKRKKIPVPAPLDDEDPSKTPGQRQKEQNAKYFRDL